MKLLGEMRLVLTPIEIRKDRKNYIVEDVHSGEYFEMPEVCIAAIGLISKELTLAEIEESLKEKYPEEEVDMVEFAQQLLELDLVVTVDDQQIKHDKQKKEDLGFRWISPAFGGFFFNRYALVIYFGLFVGNLGMFVHYPGLFPHYRDLFIFDYMTLNILAWMGITLALILFHEFGHILATRAYDLPTKLGVGHRLVLVVLETDLSQAWKLPAKDRNMLYIAGLCFDTVVMFLALMVLHYFPESGIILQGVMRVIVLDTFIRMIYQLGFYMKTDLYYLFENLTGCYNLMENAQQAIGKFIPFLRVSDGDQVTFEGERRVVHSYAIFYLVGVSLTLYVYFYFYLPQMFYALKQVLPGLRFGVTSLAFWDASFFTLQLLFGFFLLFQSWKKKYQVRGKMEAEWLE